MNIRAFQLGDGREMAELFYNTVHTVNARDYTPQQLAVWATGKMDLEAWEQSFLGHCALVAEDETGILGFGDIHPDGYLDRLYVRWDCQGQGIAVSVKGQRAGLGVKERGAVADHRVRVKKPVVRGDMDIGFRGHEHAEEDYACKAAAAACGAFLPVQQQPGDGKIHYWSQGPVIPPVEHVVQKYHKKQAACGNAKYARPIPVPAKAQTAVVLSAEEAEHQQQRQEEDILISCKSLGQGLVRSGVKETTQVLQPILQHHGQDLSIRRAVAEAGHKIRVRGNEGVHKAVERQHAGCVDRQQEKQSGPELVSGQNKYCRDKKRHIAEPEQGAVAPCRKDPEEPEERGLFLVPV